MLRRRSWWALAASALALAGATASGCGGGSEDGTAPPTRQSPATGPGEAAVGTARAQGPSDRRRNSKGSGAASQRATKPEVRQREGPPARIVVQGTTPEKARQVLGELLNPRRRRQGGGSGKENAPRQVLRELLDRAKQGKLRARPRGSGTDSVAEALQQALNGSK